MKKSIIFLTAVFLFSYDLIQFVTCKNVKNHTPVNITDTFSRFDHRVYAFAYFKNIESNKTVDFIWEEYLNNKWNLYADIKLPVYKGYRWRTFSYITIREFFKGKWRVSLFDGNKTVANKNFVIK